MGIIADPVITQFDTQIREIIIVGESQRISQIQRPLTIEPNRTGLSTSPSRSAANATETLIVEQGWKPPPKASCWLTIVRIRPVLGSATTTEPLIGPSASIAALRISGSSPSSDLQRWKPCRSAHPTSEPKPYAGWYPPRPLQPEQASWPRCAESSFFLIYGDGRMPPPVSPKDESCDNQLNKRDPLHECLRRERQRSLGNRNTPQFPGSSRKIHFVSFRPPGQSNSERLRTSLLCGRPTAIDRPYCAIHESRLSEHR